ncbi:uncharacterized protein LOC116180552 [Photinus pyralis]|uniref:Uncharacterized protein n=1 Tax=Photinus pyralis TaxID=7054 RepID=A0A1Y1K436_PHOPY|nr:uncharacterized protein LOC116180552 [Photinus pyralis]XP_031356461.1 uncharacterized protein LOC116180552 [Photinus pyralis]
MGFKIVQTTEDDEEVLTVVPDRWEENGYLYWPPGRSGYRLRKNENAIPDQTWSKSKCIVKRHNISSFKEALMQEKSMSKFDDTADEENYKCRQQEDRLHPQRKFQQTESYDFNYMLNVENLPPAKTVVPSLFIDQTIDSSKTVRCEEIKTSTTEPQDSELILISDDMGVFTLPKQVDNPQGILETTQIEKILLNQEQLFEQQEVIKKSIAGLHTQFELLLTTLEKSITTVAKESTSTDVSDEVMTSLLRPLPLSNLDQLNDLEKKLGKTLNTYWRSRGK